MNNLKLKIKTLQDISAALDPDEAARDEQLGQIQVFANQFLNNLSTTPGYQAGQPEADLSISQQPKSLEYLLGLYNREVAHKGIYASSGESLGYIPGGGIYASALADYLTDITNEYSGMAFASPGAVMIENKVLDWSKELFGFPQSALGNLTSGGSIANLIALTAARDKHQVKSARIEKSVVYLSEQAHHSIHKALKIIGLEDVILRNVELDNRHRMKSSALAQSITVDKANGLSPFLVIASAGTTDTGAVDSLEEIGKLCQAEGLWYHIDAAYGGFFILVEEKKALFKGLEMADSLVADPHKGLSLPYGLGLVLVKDNAALLHSHRHSASYMQDANGEQPLINPADVSPELTKPFRGLRLWLPLQLYGLEPFKANLEKNLMLTRYFREQLVSLGFHVGPEPDLSISYFWLPPEMGGGKMTEKLLRLIHKDGSVFLSSTRIQGRFVIRIAILSFRTKLETIDRAMTMIKLAMKKLNYLQPPHFSSPMAAKSNR